MRRSFLEGVPAKDDKPAKPPVDTVTLTALGNAISVACFIGGTLEKEGLVTIASVLASDGGQRWNGTLEVVGHWQFRSAPSGLRWPDP